MNTLEVGKSYDFLKGPEGALFDMTDAGANIIIRYRGITESEIKSFREGAFKMKITVLSGIIFVLARFDGDTMDMPYHVMMSKHLTELKEIGDNQGIQLTVMAGDAITGELKALRAIGLDTKTSKILQREISNQFGEFDFAQYNQKINEIYAKYSYKDLERFALNQ